MAQEPVRARLAELWIEPLGTSAAELAAVLHQEQALYAEAMHAIGLRAE